MAHGHKHHHSHNIDAENTVVKFFWVSFVGIFLLGLFLNADKYGILGSGLFEEGGFALLWRAAVNAWSRYLAPIFIILDILLFVIFVYALIKVWPLRAKITVFSNPHAHGHGGGHGDHGAAPAAQEHDPIVFKHWTDIVKRANTGAPENLRWAIVEADALVDTVLKARHLPGETMADRLANFRREDYKTIDRLWEAHKLRNEIAHTPGFKMTSKQAEKALFGYRDFLKEIKAF